MTLPGSRFNPPVRIFALYMTEIMSKLEDHVLPLGPLSGEHLEKRDELCAFGRRELQWPDFRIEMTIGFAAVVVKVDHIGERRETPIVHVGRREGDVPERGGLECAAIRHFAGHRVAPHVPGANNHTGIVELFVGEGRTGMACGAIGFSHEQTKTCLSFGGQRGTVTVRESVEWSVAGS